jgi:DNA-binding PadR family transcriptional regulator
MNDLLLLAMMLDEPKYGYQLKREAGWIMGEGALHNNLVYPLLRRFLDDGWVSKKAVPGERGQTRQQYALTAEGRRTLFERLHQFTEFDARSEHAFSLRVGLFAALKPEIRESILTARENYLQKRERNLAGLQDKMDLGKFGSEIVRHMRRQIAMETEWVHHLRRIVKTGDVRKVIPEKTVLSPNRNGAL